MLDRHQLYERHHAFSKYVDVPPYKSRLFWYCFISKYSNLEMLKTNRELTECSRSFFPSFLSLYPHQELLWSSLHTVLTDSDPLKKSQQGDSQPTCCSLCIIHMMKSYSPLWWYKVVGLWGGKNEALMNGISALTEENRRALSPLLPCEHTERRWPSMSKEVGSHQSPDLLVPWFWACRPPELQEINFCS